MGFDLVASFDQVRAQKHYFILVEIFLKASVESPAFQRTLALHS
jgi:hypothetical protein